MVLAPVGGVRLGVKVVSSEPLAKNRAMARRAAAHGPVDNVGKSAAHHDLAVGLEQQVFDPAVRGLDVRRRSIARAEVGVHRAAGGEADQKPVGEFIIRAGDDVIIARHRYPPAVQTLAPGDAEPGGLEAGVQGAVAVQAERG